MASITFVLREPHAKTPQPVTGLLRFDNKRVKISTGVKVLPEHWNEKKGRVKNVVDALDKDSINRLLSEVEAEGVSLINDLKAKRVEITNDLVQSHFKAFFSPVSSTPPEPIDPQKEFFDFIETFIKDSQDGKRKNHNGENVAFRSIQKYWTIETRLKEFAGVYDRPLTLQTIDEPFYNDFIEWLQKVKMYSKNNIGKYIMTIKSMINYALEENKIDKLPYRANKFKVTTEESDSIALTESELATIEALDLHNEPRLEKVRDMFLLGAFTGLRYSDLISLNQYNIKTDEENDQFIELTQQKTGNKVTIPVLPLVAEILTKYNYELPEISNQKFNDYLKEVCQMAELTAKVSKQTTKGGQKVIQIFEQWELISSHTARRSFATNAYKRGVNMFSIMDVTGHKTEKAFMKYIKITGQEKARQFKLKWLENNNKETVKTALKIA